jgi:hypothetical protein
MGSPPPHGQFVKVTVTQNQDGVVTFQASVTPQEAAYWVVNLEYAGKLSPVKQHPKP